MKTSQKTKNLKEVATGYGALQKRNNTQNKTGLVAFLRCEITCESKGQNSQGTRK